jgi:chromosomal replication initiator protein
VLESELPVQQFNTWVRPLQAIERDGELRLLAPNRYVIEWLGENSLPRIRELVLEFTDGAAPDLVLDVGTRAGVVTPNALINGGADAANSASARARRMAPIVLGGRINSDFTFDSFVEGKSNQLAKAAAIQVAGNPGKAYNPLFIYGGVGLGKTHLMHAVANRIKEHNSDARLAYVHSERFVGDMVKALQHNTINDFKSAYRSLDALMIDDIQFFAGKERSQEEFFHTFNALLESATGHSDVRSLSEGGRWPRGAAQITLWLGFDGCDRTARARNVCGHLDEQGGDVECGLAGGGCLLRRQADSLQRA